MFKGHSLSSRWRFTAAPLFEVLTPLTLLRSPPPRVKQTQGGAKKFPLSDEVYDKLKEERDHNGASFFHVTFLTQGA